MHATKTKLQNGMDGINVFTNHNSIFVIYTQPNTNNVFDDINNVQLIIIKIH